MDTSIQLNKDKDIVYSSFTFHKNGLTANGSPTFEQWEEVGKFIKKSEGAVRWWWGDWLSYGEAHYKEDYSQAEEITGLSYNSLRDSKRVSEAIPIARRRADIDWSIHQEVSPFSAEEQEKLLDKAKELKLTQKQLRKEKHRMVLEEKRPITTLDDNLILGDALQELLTIPNQSIDCVITDPPYGIDYQSNRREVKPQLDKLQNDKDEAFELLDKTCAILQQKVKSNSHLYFFTSWKVYSKFEAVIGKYFTITNVLVWDKLNHGTGDLEGNYGEQYELIIFANTGRRILNGDRPTNIIMFNRVANNIHPTEKPVGLIERLIEVSTNEGECVLDPFMGAGSTCIAAKNKKRNYYGIEIDKQWFDEAQRRIHGND